MDANLGVTDDDLLGDFGDNFNILEFADALGKFFFISLIGTLIKLSNKNTTNSNEC